MLVLGIESSCDDLSMAAIQDGKLLANVTASQTLDHAPFGGVVPEIASRRHLDHLEGTLDLLLSKSGLALKDIEGIAATFAPGLVGSLLVGLNFGKALAFALNVPFRGVHHIEAHLWSAFLENEPEFPFLALIVSGGHTHLYWVTGFGEYRMLGHTVDDAAGEAFDKVAKLMGLGFPGGPEIERLAKTGNPNAFAFRIPQVKGKPFHTSFSGMKTAALEYFREAGSSSAADLAASFQDAVVRSLRAMVEQALAEMPARQIVLAGGVACNGPLRAEFLNLAQSRQIPLLIPAPRFCTDNGAMVAFLGEKYLVRAALSPYSLNAQARLPLGA